jgi:hypothetical protein
MSEESYELAGARFEETKVDLATFEKDLTLEDWTRIRVIHPWFPPPIDVISPIKTIGKGRTNLTLGAPDILQTDAATPYASFSYRQTPAGGPFVSVHFEPAAYGITTPATYVIAFLLESSSAVSLVAGGYAAGGTLSGTGAKTLVGKKSLAVVLENVPANGQVNAYIQQTSSGGPWTWYSTSIEYPPLIIQIGGLEP